MGKMKHNESVSIILRTRNEERWIGHSIQSILDLISKPEIIIVDNNSTDQTLQIARYFMQDPLLKDNTNKNYTKIKIKNIIDYSPGKSLNLGIKLATNKIILIMSAHCQLKSINLEKHINDLKKYVCVYGNQNPIYYGKKITKRYVWSNFTKVEKVNYFSKLENRYFMHNAISMFNKSYMTKNKFNENLQGKEDRYWINQQVKKNKKFLYDPSLEVDHHYTANGNTWKGIG